MGDTLRIAGVQLDPTLGDVAANRALVLRATGEVIDSGARLVVLPECAVTGYCFESKAEALEVAEEVPGPTTDALIERCAASGAVVVIGLLRRVEDALCNAAVVCGPEGIIGVYHKTHLPTLGVDRFVTAGTEALAVYPTPAGRLGPLICYDARFPEPSRVLALAGAQIITLPTNWPQGSEKVPEYVVRTRALENCCYFIAVNRCGVERGFTFVGRSTIAGPDGSILAQARADGPDTITAEIDVSAADVKDVIVRPDAHEFHFWRDRRTDLYGPIVGER